MNYRIVSKPIFGIATLLLTSLALPQLRAQINSNDAARIGLEVAWETNIGGAQLANKKNSFVIWPHSTAKREFVTVRTGGRVIQRISGDEIDHLALEKAIEQGARPAQPPRLGLAGASQKAEKLVATYKILGKKIELEPFSQQLAYIVTLTTNGNVVALDAESGAILWKAEAGDSRLPMYGPGVSDENVVVTNGNKLYVYDLETGSLVSSRDLIFTPSGTPTAIPGKAIVPSIEGRLVAYDVKNFKIPPVVLRSGNENRLGVTGSADRNFLSWPMESRLFLAKAEKAPKLWSSIDINESISNVAVAVQGGFVFCGRNGTVVNCSTDRSHSVRWNHRLGIPVSKSPVANKDFVFVVSDDGLLSALSLTNGSLVWDGPARNIKDIVAVGKQHIYVTNSSNALLVLDLATGIETLRSNFVTPDVLPNTISDRLFFVNAKGQLTCLREIDSRLPTYVADFKASNGSPDTTKLETATESSSQQSNDSSTMLDSADENPTTTVTDPFADPF